MHPINSMSSFSKNLKSSTSNQTSPNTSSLLQASSSVLSNSSNHSISSLSCSYTSLSFLSIRIHTIEGTIQVLPLQTSITFSSLISKLATLCIQYTNDEASNSLWLLPDGSVFTELSWNTYMSEKLLSPSLPDLPLFVYPLLSTWQSSLDLSMSSNFQASLKIQSKAWTTLSNLEKLITLSCQPPSSFLIYIQTLEQQLERVQEDLEFLEKLNVPSSLYPGCKQSLSQLLPSNLKDLTNRIKQQLELCFNFRNQLQTLSDRICKDYLPTKPTMEGPKPITLHQYAMWLSKGLNFDTQAKQVYSSIQRSSTIDFHSECVQLHRFPSSFGASLGECLRRSTWQNTFHEVAQLIEVVMHQWKHWEKQRRQMFDEQVACYLPSPINLEKLSTSSVREDLVGVYFFIIL
ncbi:hypothetical protein HMI54_006411 [Coelomomyces lativittatus]|nr:hypothetical protein HMI54_006411 [Coelomomyces lativittatus]